MKHEDLKCEECDGTGEREINVDGADCPCVCIFCGGTGIDDSQLIKLFKENGWDKYFSPSVVPGK
jgi:hypothetical protein